MILDLIFKNLTSRLLSIESSDLVLYFLDQNLVIFGFGFFNRQNGLCCVPFDLLLAHLQFLLLICFEPLFGFLWVCEVQVAHVFRHRWLGLTWSPSMFSLDHWSLRLLLKCYLSRPDRRHLRIGQIAIASLSFHVINFLVSVHPCGCSCYISTRGWQLSIVVELVFTVLLRTESCILVFRKYWVLCPTQLLVIDVKSVCFLNLVVILALLKQSFHVWLIKDSLLVVPWSEIDTL